MDQQLAAKLTMMRAIGTQSSRADNRAEERLDSWKEVAKYLKRDVRTVRRWEKDEGLPVHRRFHHTRASIYAFRSELDLWWTNGCNASRSQPGHFILAVLPFHSLNSLPEDEKFADGLTAELIMRLGRINRQMWGVIARTTVMQYRVNDKSIVQIGRELGAGLVLEGTVRRLGDRIRITAQLVQSHDQTHVWAESYERNASDPFAAQSDVASRVVRALEMKLLPLPIDHGSSAGSSVHRTYLKGRFYWNKRTAEGLRNGILCFKQVLGEDPDYALAHAGLADCYLSLGFYGIEPALASMKKAKSAALKAVELNVMSGEAHTSLAKVMLYVDWNLHGAGLEYERAIELNPNYATGFHWYADYLALLGRFDEALEMNRRAAEIDPTSPIISVWSGMMHFWAGQYDEAIEQHQDTLEMHPNYVLARWGLGLAYERKAMYSRAVDEHEKAVKIVGRMPWIIAGLGHTYAVSGREHLATKFLSELKEMARNRIASEYDVATVHAGLNEHDSAMVCLRSAYEKHSGWLPYLGVDPRLNRLRSEGKCQELLNRMGLVV